ncbi:hypothetical protein [Micromonospora mirobrigensis]|uniref:Uncharacterized protein n=1 Tax=Micromonospora mirobrigensis TaxID=262898 RepID=A0A1C4VTR1_9ACTN|nr:hypothetical protein [Micromonospora mirobrigensis]SCE87367.1 hypothetical protein GA0070564_1011450 [Micromonospora mirobrigensis]
MARQGWGGAVATAIGVAAGAGAAQLGFGYGLGIINWAPPAGAGNAEAAWVASLVWATWIAASSVIAGAVCGQRLSARAGADDAPGGTLRRWTLAAAGAVGALITILLVAVPARAAVAPDTFSPQSIAAGYAGIGVLIGLLTAGWVLHTRSAAANVIATAGWLWLLAVVSVVDGVLAGRGLTTAQLGIWQLSADRAGFWIRNYFYWPGALLAMGSAALIGALAARRGARDAHRRIGAAASGAAGPLLVAVAYFLAVPRLATIGREQVSAHLIAPYAVIAGVAASVLVAALAQRAERRSIEAGGDRPAAAEPVGSVAVPRQRTGGDPIVSPADSGPTDSGPAAASVAGAAPTTGRATAAAVGTTASSTEYRSASAAGADPAPPAAPAGRARAAGRRTRAGAGPTDSSGTPEATTTPPGSPVDAPSGGSAAGTAPASDTAPGDGDADVTAQVPAPRSRATRRTR